MPRSIIPKEYLAPGFLLAAVAFVTLQLQSIRGDISDMNERLVRVEVEVEKIGPLSAKVDSLGVEVGSLRSEVGSLRSEVADIDKRLTGVEGRLLGVEGRLSAMEEREARRELLQELHRQLERRFDEANEGVAYGGPGPAVDRLLLRAKPDVDAALADVLDSPRSESPVLLAQDISNDLWERRMQFLERTPPALP